MAVAAARLLVAVVGAVLGLASFDGVGVAEAHGPVAPVASSFEARVGGAPAGIDARVVDGDQRMWMRVAATETVVVLDYRGAPYLRFSPAGVQVNQSSAMYYLNLTPSVPPPANLTPAMRPSWRAVTSGHAYSWHDGRLHALASEALAPGSSYVGAWRVPVVVAGRLSAISGGLWHAGAPSLVWFWPIAVLLLCVPAAMRLLRPELDARLSLVLSVTALAAIAVAALSRGLYGRPTVSALQLVVPGLTVAFVGWGVYWLLARRAGPFFSFVIAILGIFEGAVLLPTLWNGYVLTAVPAFVARAAAVVCLGCSLGLLPLAFRSASAGEAEPADEEWIDEADREITPAG